MFGAHSSHISQIPKSPICKNNRFRNNLVKNEACALSHGPELCGVVRCVSSVDRGQELVGSRFDISGIVTGSIGRSYENHRKHHRKIAGKISERIRQCLMSFLR